MPPHRHSRRNHLSADAMSTSSSDSSTRRSTRLSGKRSQLPSSESSSPTHPDFATAASTSKFVMQKSWSEKELECAQALFGLKHGRQPWLPPRIHPPLLPSAFRASRVPSLHPPQTGLVKVPTASSSSGESSSPHGASTALTSDWEMGRAGSTMSVEEDCASQLFVHPRLDLRYRMGKVSTMSHGKVCSMSRMVSLEIQ